MNKLITTALSLGIGAVIGIGGTILVTNTITRQAQDEAIDVGTHRMPDGSLMHDEANMKTNDMQLMMAKMSTSLEGKTGDEFDQAFLAEMIVHHQGAIDMANAALASAKHQEIKDLANAIIKSQSGEVDLMTRWQQTWYPY